MYSNQNDDKHKTEQIQKKTVDVSIIIGGIIGGLFGLFLLFGIGSTLYDEYKAKKSRKP